MVKRRKGRKLLWFDCLLTRTHRDSSAALDIVTLNPFRFSSEYYDSELDLVYYNYRHYSPSLGRFLSRDPIEEQGGWNLYAFVGNQLSTQHDILGESMIAPGAGAWYPTLPSWPTRPLQADEDSWGVVVAVGQTSLDIIGLIPSVGEFADGANTIIYMCQGDGLSASLSASSMIPIGGQVVAIGKLSNGAKNALEKAHTKLLSISDKEKKSILCSTCGPSSYPKKNSVEIWERGSNRYPKLG